MGEMRIMDPHAGDLKIAWDPRNKDEVEAAEDHFDKARKRGMVAYRVDDEGKKTSIMTKFDPKAGAIIFAPFVAGG